MTTAIRSIGLQLLRGDGGVGAGTKASKTIGTVNQQLKVLAKAAGTYGNALQFGIVVSGNNTAFSISVSSTQVVVTSATNGGGTATTTVLQAIAALYADPTFDANFDATVGSGDGSGVLVAGATGVLSGGAAGAEVFTLIPGLTDVAGPNQSTDEVDVTAYDSPGGRREYILGLIDSGEITGTLNVNFGETTHQQLYDDFLARDEHNYQLRFSDGEGFDVTLLLKGFEFQSPIDSQVSANMTWRITGDITPTF